MTTDLTAVVRRMLELERSLGRVENIASLTTTTAVITALATGTVSSGKYGGKWMKRPQAASAADRVRLSTEAGFSSTTGTLTHAGANYADTTATNETLQLLEHEPYLFDLAVQRSLQATRKLDRFIYPTRNAVERYWMHECPWVTEPSDLWRVYRTSNPVLSRNRHLDKWNAYSSTGVLTPDNFTLSGTSATMARSTTGVRTGQYSVAVTRSGTDWVLEQTIGLLETEVSADSLRGQTVTAVLVGQSGNASDLEVEVTDGVDTSTSTAHTGGSTVEELSKEHTVNAAATTLTLRARGNVDGVTYVNQLYLVLGSLTDDVRRDQSRIVWEAQPSWEQSSTLQMHLPAAGLGGQYVVESWRPYPQLDAARVLAGSADADVIDAPVELVARVALGFLYESLPSTPENLAKAAEWTAIGAQARAQHMTSQRTQRTGLEIPAPAPGPRPQRPY